ncbi:D-xylose 1-dehydrogenase Gfo6 [Salinirubrum litoreum]|uniref:D-xylose 1-dehydrogenase Gfo6 n=1 Tax=Salinirubrum litoreum TaxID=1126234 RepID=A0ABD5R7Z8_9EURY|nr:D-xylose 1-dehydrogenase Gfo6 [Salinirubrum litoreum]
MTLASDLTDLTARDWETGPEGVVRFAVVGLGGFARNAALPALVEADYCEPTVVVSGSAEKADRIAAEFDADHGLTYEAYADGAARDAYDAVYVVTPNALHLPHVETACEFGKGILCEKPLEATPDRAEAVVSACETAGVPLMTAYRMQTDPVVRRLRELVRSGGIGDPIQLHGGFSIDVLGGSRGPDQWRLDRDLAGGGALMDVGVYPLNTARFLLDGDPTAVAGTTSGDGPFADVDESVAFQLRFPEDVTASFTAGFSGDGERFLTIRGSEGTVELRNAFSVGGERRVRVRRDDGEIDLTGPGTDEVREEFDYFADAVLSGWDIGPDGQDGLTDVRAMQGVYESAASDEWVEL